MAPRLHFYRTYGGAIDQKAPVIFQVKTILQDEGLYSKKRRKILSGITGVAVSTYDGWFEGDTLNPRTATVGATVTAIGYELTFKKVRDIDEDEELKKQADWLLRQHNIRGGQPKPVRKAAPTKRANGIAHRNGVSHSARKGR